MAKTIKTSDLSSTAERILSPPLVKVDSGKETRQLRWETIRGRASTMILSDTDIGIYYSLLASNKARAQIKTLLSLLCEAIVLLEESTEGVVLRSPLDETELVGRAKLASLLLEIGEIESLDELIDLRPSLLKTGLDYLGPLEAETMKNSGVKRNYSSRGYIRSVIGEAARVADKVENTLSTMSSMERDLRNLLAPFAIKSVSTNSAALIGDIDDEEIGSTRFLTALVGLSSVNMLLAPKSLTEKIDTRTNFPFQMDINSSRTKLYFLVDGSKQDILQLNVLPGDIVTEYPTGDIKTILSVDATSITVTSPLSSETQAVSVRSPAQEDYLMLLDSLSLTTAYAPTTLALMYSDPILREISRPEAAEMVEVLANLGSNFGLLTDEASTSLQKLGLSVPSPSAENLMDILKNYSPRISDKTKESGDFILDSVENAGFDKATNSLLSGDLTCLSEKEFAYATTVGHVSRSMEDFVFAALETGREEY